MKNLELDLNKLSDTGVMLYLQLKEEMNKVKREEIERNNEWVSKIKPKDEPEVPLPPLYDDYDEEDDESEDD